MIDNSRYYDVSSMGYEVLDLVPRVLIQQGMSLVVELPRMPVPKSEHNTLGSCAVKIYESPGEGGLVLTLGAHEVRRDKIVETVNASVTYIGATGSLIHRVNHALNKALGKPSS